MFEHTHWVNRYREKLSHKGIPYYKQLGLFEQPENTAQTVQANPSPTPNPAANATASPTPIAPNEASKQAPAKPNINEVPKDASQGVAAKTETQKNNPRVQFIFSVFIERLRQIDDTVDAYIKSAIKNGGNMLDHFDVEPLNTIYSNMGFVEVNRYKYDPQYDIDGKFASKYGKLDVIYRKLK